MRCTECGRTDSEADVRITRTACRHEHVAEDPLCEVCRGEIDSGMTTCGPCSYAGGVPSPANHECALQQRAR